MNKIIFSTVLFNTPWNDFKSLIASINLLDIELNNGKSHKIVIELYIWDNSKLIANYLNQIKTLNYKFKIDLFSSGKNIGYGLGHNSNLLRY